MTPLLRAALAAFVLLSAGSARAAAPGERLEKVVILSRHGVRAAMSSPERLEEASARPWPRFSVPPGHLTARGEALASLMGGYFHDHYVAEGLLERRGDCGAASYWANVTQRTIATAQAVGRTLSPGCAVAVGTVGEGRVDPMFEPVKAGVVVADPALARAAVAGRAGGDLAAWSASHRDAIERLDALLMQCPAGPCPPSPGKRRIFDAKPGFAEDEELVSLSGPEAFASGVTESLLMAWADGQDFAGQGWRGFDEDALTRVFALHQAEFDLRLRTPYVAKTLGGPLARRILATLEPEGSDGMIGPAGARIVFVAGHDGTLAVLGGLLRLEWALPGYQPNQIGPGGALVFERWRRADGVRVIRARFTGQSLRQLREAAPLTQATPPLSAPVFIPGCSTATPAFDCPLDRFEAVVSQALAS
ncbi:4-phytase/acid phosphatase [Caulobacter rhizosphaerae]|uniref:4-phytase/acid phosphatase n=1 Tax=Caulobacter rhizosphaerae TaxID=2010972 RepID=A0ABU1MTG3_9CAUL|nr:histidine-type phosphatase [Caulobacter rhizosphaerae]MDR6529474.1 4-phytase/acid phosphatase [Caulobacter rhizosphaerae]